MMGGVGVSRWCGNSMSMLKERTREKKTMLDDSILKRDECQAGEEEKGAG